MPDQADRLLDPAPSAHGATMLAGVVVDAYNAELRAPEGFLGDRASGRAFRSILEWWRGRLRELDDDPLGGTPTEAISRRQLDRVLTDGDPEAAGLVHGVVEEFAQSLAEVLQRLLRLEAWQGTERIVVGGGMRGSRVGELAIGRAAMLLKDASHVLDLVPIRHDPDEAGLIGSLHLAPPGLLTSHDAVLAVDIGGTSIRAGVVRTHRDEAPDLSLARVWASERWRHSEEEVSRDEAMERLGTMLRGLAGKAEEQDLALAPFIGIGCPGQIRADGVIERGAQNLPGHWESDGFNLPCLIRALVPEVAGRPTVVVLHNDAVTQGLSQKPFMQDVSRWGALTIGTGLGNARFTNLRPGA